MKKFLLFSLFTLLSVAMFAQHGGCGANPHSNTSSGDHTTVYATPEESVKLDFKIFPNPATEYFVLDALSLEKGNATRIQVYNTMGQRVRNFTVAKDTRYNVSDLKDGMYLIQFVDAKDQTITTQKLYKSDHITRF